MSSIVLQLQEEALDKRVTTTELLRKAFVVARKLGLVDFQDWLRAELDGYADGDKVPEYRKLRGRIKSLNPYRGWIPVMFEDDQVEDLLSRAHCGQPISELEELVNRAKPNATLIVPLSHELTKHQEHPMETVLHLSASAVGGILDKVRNHILSWSLTLEEQGILGEGLSFSAQEKQKAAATQPHSTVNNFFGSISNSQIAQNSSTATQHIYQQGDSGRLRDFVQEVRRRVDELELSPEAQGEILAELVTLESQAASPNPKQVIIREAGGSVRRILEGAATGAGATLLQQLAQFLL